MKKIMSKSMLAKKARAGKDLGKPGKGFQKGVTAIMAKGLPKMRAQAIMGAQLQKMRKAGKL